MARTQLWLEDFEGITENTISQKYLTSDTSQLAIGPSYGRTGNGLRVNPTGGTGGSSSGFWIPFAESAGAWIVEFAFRVIDFGSVGQRAIITFQSATNDEFGVVLGGLGLAMYRASNISASVLNQTWVGGQPLLNTWHQMAIRYVGDDADGECYLWMDGQLIAFPESPDTLATASAPIQSIRIGSSPVGVSANGTQIYDIDDLSIAMSDDFYVGPGDDWQPQTDVELEPYAIITLRPESDNVVDFIPSASPSDNYAMVDEADNDGDTTYNSSDTVGHADYFNIEDIPSGYTGGEILAAQLNVVARQTYPGGRGITPIINGRAGEESFCSVDYKTHSFLIVDDGGSPAAQLDDSGINSTVIGYEITT